MTGTPETPLDVLLPTIGSAGDVHPAIELGSGLKQRGHRATVVTHPFFEQQIRDAGLEFVPLGREANVAELLRDPRLWHPTKAFGFIAEHAIIPAMEPLYRIIEQRQSRSLVVAASGICLGARVAQEKLGVPTATVHLQPAMLRSLVDGGKQGRLRMDPSVPKFIKRGFFWLADKFMIDRVLEPPLNSFRASLSLPPVYGILKQYVHSPQLVIGMFAGWFAPMQPDWPPNTHLAGFVLHDDSHRQAISADVEDFLAAGPPPLVFTPGSAGATMHEFFRDSVEACRIGGYRAMLVTNFPEQLPANLPNGVRAFSYLPFSQILPRCAALIYPGGIGTMAQAIKAGVPHLVVPHAHDQPDNAFRVQRLGLGDWIYPERYKAPRVARALSALLASANIKARCAEYAVKIDSLCARQRACSLIESLRPGK